MSLFSGIGGFELAAEWMGWDNLVSCEINDFGRKVLDYYWPNAYHHNDIHTLTYERINEELTQRYGAEWRSDDIILTGGFPCQPYSAAGKRLGNEDDRHLWPQMLRVIREVRPTWVVGENVLGLVNWNGGLVFDEVQADLEAEGYEVQPYVLPAAGVGAPHRRDRVWFVAYSRNESRGSEQRCKNKPQWELLSREQQGSTIRSTFARYSGIGSYPYTDSDGHDEQSKTGDNTKRKDHKQSRSQRISTIEGPCDERDASNTEGERHEPFDTHRTAVISAPSESGIYGRGSNGFGQPTDWRDFPTQPPVRSRNDGIPSRLDGITVSKHRNESIKAYGNAIVPQVAYQIFKAIQQYKDTLP